MTIRYDTARKRIICRWAEPVKVLMNKKEGVMNRFRTISVKVNDSGSLSGKESRRLQDHPMFSYICRFNSLLKDHKSSDGEHDHACSICKQGGPTTPYYDIKTRTIAWLCGEHRDQPSQMNT
ncbi:hypothetical protein OAN24_03415 [Pseudodesulfovibrio sp.]|nr:hypothetical protein [Pseudodesulfovibrio sp.]